MSKNMKARPLPYDQYLMNLFIEFVKKCSYATINICKINPAEITNLKKFNNETLNIEDINEGARLQYQWYPKRVIHGYTWTNNGNTLSKK